MRLSADLIALGLATGLATFAGGALALRLEGRARGLMAFTRGAVLGVALLELLPAAWATAGPGTSGFGVANLGPLAWALLAFLAYLALDRGLSAAAGGGASAHRGHLGAASLTLHSLMDGLVVGLAFHASPALGATVAVAVIAHDFADGVNTVNLSLAGGGGRGAAGRWLVADALAPTLGIFLAQGVAIPASGLSPLLAALAGLLLYAGVGEAAFRPGDWSPRPMTALAAMLGFGLIFGVSRFVAA